MKLFEEDDDDRIEHDGQGLPSSGFDDDPDTEDDEADDFFLAEGEEEEEAKPKIKKQKEPQYKRSDPRYWDREESQWDHLRPRRPVLIWLYIIGTVLCIGLLWWAFIQVFGVYQDHGVKYGYVESVSKEGKVFKTFEGNLIPYREIMDTTRVYDRDFPFSIKNDTISAWLWKMQDSGIPVKLTYKVYNTALPWRGKSRVMVIAADTADASRLLPPEFAPRLQETP